jgi:hypothetical protein
MTKRPQERKTEAGLKTLAARKALLAAVQRGASEEEITKLRSEVESRAAAEEVVS